MSNPMRALLNHFGVLLSVVCLYPVPQRTTLLNQFRDWGAAVSLTCSQGTETADTDVQIRINIQVQANAADPTGVRIRCIDFGPLHALVGRPSRPVFVVACVFFPCRLACSAHVSSLGRASASATDVACCSWGPAAAYVSRRRQILGRGYYWIVCTQPQRLELGWSISIRWYGPSIDLRVLLAFAPPTD